MSDSQRAEENGFSTGNVLHVANNATLGVILASGTFGGVDGPSEIYEDLAERLKASGITAVRLHYTTLHQIASGIKDVLAAISDLVARRVRQVLLVGWSFGAAVVINTALRSEVVVAVAMIAAHQQKAEAIGLLAPRSLLLIHCSDDKVMRVKHAEALYNMANEPKELIVFRGGDHDFSDYRTELMDKLFEWCMSFAHEKTRPTT